MKRLLLFVAVAALMGTTQVQAQEPAYLQPVESQEPTLSDQGMSAELWWRMKLYKDAQDPAIAVRAKAAEKAQARRDRIAARKWYGFSNARPTASPIPYFGSYSPSWVGSRQHPYHWTGHQYSSAPSEESTSDSFSR